MTTYHAADATLLGAGRAEGTSRRAVTPAEPRTFATANAAAVDTLFTAILCALPLTELRTTYPDWGFLAVGGAGIALGLALGYLAVRLRLPAALTALGAALGYLVIGGPLLDRADCVAGIVPTPLALRTLADTAVGGWKQLLTTPIPVTASGTLLAVPFILALSCALLSLVVARRLTAAAAPLVPPLLLLAGTIALGARAHAPWALIGAATAALCLAWNALRARHAGVLAAGGIAATDGAAAQDGSRRLYKLAAALVVAAVAGGFTLVISPLLPGSAAADRSVLRDQVIPPLDLSAYPSPLVGYRKYTQDANQLWDQELFKVSGLPANTPVRIATLDDYNGSVWGATNRGATGGFLRVGPVIAPDAADATAVPGPVSTVRITIAPAYAAASDINAWLPTAGSVSGIGFSGTGASDAAASLRYNTSSSSGVVINRLTAGTMITLQTDLAAPVMPAAAQPYGPPDLTDGYSAEFSARAATWAKGAAGIGPQLQAIASYLRTQGAYSDGGPGESQYLPGHSAFRLTGFLNGPQPVGDDEQYAAAYALMASSLGMPARVVLGAIPESDGTVRGKDVHAWVEIHVVGGAWVRIPDSAFMPDTTKKPDQQPPQQLQDAAATPVPPPNAAHPPTSDLEPHATGFSTNPPPPPPPGDSLAWLISLLIDTAWILSPFLFAGAVLATASGLKARRRHRRRTGGTAAARYAAGWRELVDYARDLGVTVPDRVTRRTQSQALLAFDLADLAWTADLVVYGPLEPSPEQAAAYWERVDAARKAMGRASRRRRRILAPLSLRSVRAATAEGSVR